MAMLRTDDRDDPLERWLFKKRRAKPGIKFDDQRVSTKGVKLYGRRSMTQVSSRRIDRRDPGDPRRSRIPRDDVNSVGRNYVRKFNEGDKYSFKRGTPIGMGASGNAALRKRLRYR